ncbi:MAG TPA: 3'-5' exonuclease, partial [Acidimicrobiales bacterium]
MTASAAPARETASLWAGLRIVVLDTETTGSVTGDRVLSIGAVSVINGEILDPWSVFCNAHCAITPGSQRKHHLTEEFLADKPVFGQIAEELLAYLAPRTEGEQVVVCGHNPGFDVARLRSELIRVGMDLPTLRVLDTRATTKAVGLDVPDGSLESLLDVLKTAN